MRLLIAIGMVLISSTVSLAGIVQLAWDHDGAGHKGFRIYYGRTSHASVVRPANTTPDPAPYEMMTEILDPSARQYEMLVPEGRYYFRLTAIGEQIDSVFTTEEPMAAVGIDAPSHFKVEWVITKTTPIERE